MIAPRRAEKRRLERNMRLLLGVVAVEVVAVLLVIGFFVTSIWSVSNKTQATDLELAKLEPVVEQIEYYEKETQKLMPKLKLLESAKESTMRWYNSLDKLTQSMPESTFLTKVETKDSAQKKDSNYFDVKIEGVSPNHTKVGEAMMRLSTIDDFDRIDLIHTKESGVEDISVIEFLLNAKMKSGPQGKNVEGGNTNES